MWTIWKSLVKEARGGDWVIQWLVYADDAVLVVENNYIGGRVMNDFVEVSRGRTLGVHVAQSKAMVVEKQGESEWSVRMRGGTLKVEWIGMWW